MPNNVVSDTGRGKDPGTDTRTRVIRAATQVFAEHGYQKATIAEISRLAGLSEAGIYEYFQGKEEIAVLAAYRLLSPLVRTASAVLLVWLGFGLVGASAGFPLSQLLLVCLIAYILLTTKEAKKHLLSLRKSISLMVFANVLMMAVIYLDLFFVRFFLSAEQAGVYNTAAMTSKVLFFTTNALVVVLLPKASKLSLNL